MPDLKQQHNACLEKIHANSHLQFLSKSALKGALDVHGLKLKNIGPTYTIFAAKQGKVTGNIIMAIQCTLSKFV